MSAEYTKGKKHTAQIIAEKMFIDSSPVSNFPSRRWIMIQARVIDYIREKQQSATFIDLLEVIRMKEGWNTTFNCYWS